jgi:hypothetical protein
VQSPGRVFLGRRTVVIAAHEMNGNPGPFQDFEPGREVRLGAAPGAERAVEKIPQHHKPFAPMGV